MRLLISRLTGIFLAGGIWCSFVHPSFACEFIFSDEKDMLDFIEFVNKIKTKYSFRAWTDREINALYKAHRVGLSRGATHENLTAEELIHKIYMPHYQADIPVSLTKKMVQDGTL